MRKYQFDHVIGAAAEVTGEREIVVIGSQAILGSVNDPPKSMLLSIEADVYPLRNPAKAIETDGATASSGSRSHRDPDGQMDQSPSVWRSTISS